MSVAEGVVDFGDGGAELVAVHAEVEIDGVEGDAEVTGGGDQEVGLVGLDGREEGIELSGDGLVLSVEVIGIAEAEGSEGVVPEEEGMVCEGGEFGEVEGEEGGGVGEGVAPGVEAFVVDLTAKDSGV